MALATIRGGVSDTRTMKLAHTAAVEKNEVIVSGGHVLVACDDYDADEEGVYVYRGRASFPNSAAAKAAGAVVYWDATAENITTTATANTRAGILTEAAGASDTECFVSLHEN